MAAISTDRSDQINNLITAQTLFAPYVSTYISAGASSSHSASSSSPQSWQLQLPTTIDPRTMSMPLYPPEDPGTLTGPVSNNSDSEMTSSTLKTAAVSKSISGQKNFNHPLSTTDKLRLALGQRGKTLSSYNLPDDSAGNSGGSVSAAAAANLTLAEYSKLSSKEKRQLRNKVSARTFRVRRKEYIDHLEEQISLRDSEIEIIRNALEAAKLENSNLRLEVDQLKMVVKDEKMSHSVTAPSQLRSSKLALPNTQTKALTEIEPISTDLENLQPGSSILSAAVRIRPNLQSSQRSVLTPNTRKDLSAYGTSFGSTGFGGGYTVVHMSTPSSFSNQNSEFSFEEILRRPFLPLSNLKSKSSKLVAKNDSCKALWGVLLAIPS